MRLFFSPSHTSLSKRLVWVWRRASPTQTHPGVGISTYNLARGGKNRHLKIQPRFIFFLVWPTLFCYVLKDPRLNSEVVVASPKYLCNCAMKNILIWLPDVSLRASICSCQTRSHLTAKWKVTASVSWLAKRRKHHHLSSFSTTHSLSPLVAWTGTETHRVRTNLEEKRDLHTSATLLSFVSGVDEVLHREDLLLKASS